MKRGIIFDLDGALVDSMPTHVQAWRAAFLKIAGLEVSDRDIYILEGMRGIELVEKIFGQKGFQKRELAQKVHDEKSRIFKSIRSSKPFEGVPELIKSIKCAKAVVSGSTKRDVETIVEESFGRDSFDLLITADDIKKGKPDPSAFLEALKRLGVGPKEATVVENAPLGARAAQVAGIDCYVVLNNTPLSRADFGGVVPQDRILEKTGKLKSKLGELCQ